jgi:hypothetical protein
MATLNIEYVHLADLPIGQQTCLQQLYSKKFNALRTNIMRIGNSFRHASMIKKEQPKEAGWYNRKYKRGKAIFLCQWGFKKVMVGKR